jgi:hypothetical protein
LGIRQEKSPTAQITRSFYRQISTIAGDFIGMMGFPNGRTRICVVPGAGALIRGIIGRRAAVPCFVCLAEIPIRFCVRHVCLDSSQFRRPKGADLD